MDHQDTRLIRETEIPLIIHSQKPCKLSEPKLMTVFCTLFSIVDEMLILEKHVYVWIQFVLCILVKCAVIKVVLIIITSVT